MRLSGTSPPLRWKASPESMAEPGMDVSRRAYLYWSLLDNLE